MTSPGHPFYLKSKGQKVIIGCEFALPSECHSFSYSEVHVAAR